MTIMDMMYNSFCLSLLLLKKLLSTIKSDCAVLCVLLNALDAENEWKMANE